LRDLLEVESPLMGYAGLDPGEVSGAPALYRRNQGPLPTSVADLGTQGCPAGIGDRASSSVFD